MSFSGTLASINAALDGLRFDPTPNFNGSALLSLATNDLGNTGSGGPKTAAGTVALAVHPVNDAPTVADQSVGGQEDTPLSITHDGPPRQAQPSLTEAASKAIALQELEAARATACRARLAPVNLELAPAELGPGTGHAKT